MGVARGFVARSFARGLGRRSAAWGLGGRSAARAGYLDLCLPLFTAPVKLVAETGFARISGHYRGHVFDVQVVPDSLNLRKLPCLWLLVSLVEPLALAGRYNIMLRATGAETFSKFGNLPDQVAVPAGFPDGCTIRTDARCVAPKADVPKAVMPVLDVPVAQVPSAAIIGRYMTGLDAASLKEVVVAPTGVRVVWLTEQADRGRYLLFRDAEMGGVALPADVLAPLMDGLCDLWTALRADAAPQLLAVG